MRYLSLFSGIEAASVAWADLGWHPVAFCEIDSFPSAVLSYRFSDVPNLGDITKVDWTRFKEDHGTVDLIVGGSPCQSFSVAGRREGLDGESGLMYEYLRAVRDVRPRWVLWENVPGVFSIDNGRAFGTLITALQDLGYGVAWRVLDAQFFGVAQRRRRVFLVGCLGEVGSAAAVLFERDSLRGNTKTSREK
ncbi:MAG: DNA cytosine methyltransferase, partial [Coriobacteriales bacterium]|nr:DNA cytosine methyltransferase [Coriobacteriales bacterium]